MDDCLRKDFKNRDSSDRRDDAVQIDGTEEDCNRVRESTVVSSHGLSKADLEHWIWGYLTLRIL